MEEKIPFVWFFFFLGLFLVLVWFSFFFPEKGGVGDSRGRERERAGGEGAEEAWSRAPEEAGAGVPSQPGRGTAASPAAGGPSPARPCVPGAVGPAGSGWGSGSGSGSGSAGRRGAFLPFPRSVPPARSAGEPGVRGWSPGERQDGRRGSCTAP